MKILLISRNKEVYEKLSEINNKNFILCIQNEIKIKEIINSEQWKLIIIDFTFPCNNYKNNFYWLYNSMEVKIPMLALIEGNRITEQIEILSLGVYNILKYPLTKNDYNKCMKEIDELNWFTSWKKKRES